MDAKTLEALNASIAKWEKNAAVERIGQVHMLALGCESCPLCRVFHTDYAGYTKGRKECSECPVRERTGKPFCRGTPYSKARRCKGGSDVDAFRAAAKEEAAFLRSLLPVAQ